MDENCGVNETHPQHRQQKTLHNTVKAAELTIRFGINGVALLLYIKYSHFRFINSKRRCAREPPPAQLSCAPHEHSGPSHIIFFFFFLFLPISLLHYLSLYLFFFFSLFSVSLFIPLFLHYVSIYPCLIELCTDYSFIYFFSCV